MCTRSIIILFLHSLVVGCSKESPDEKPQGIDFRHEMRVFVEEISSFGRSQRPGFIVIPQNGQELLTSTGEADGLPETDYINALDGVGREELFYGYDNNDDMPTPSDDSNYWLGLCTYANDRGLKVLVTDYCFTPSRMQDSYLKNEQQNFISFAATHRELDNIPSQLPYNVNNADINTLSDARNFLYLINTQAYSTKQQFIDALMSCSYDVILMDAFFQENDLSQTYTMAEISGLKTKPGGGKRLVIAYLSIGEAEDYRYYWNNEWKSTKPAWLGRENPQWQGNYEVRYWMPEWKQLITGNDSSYLQKILDAGFDGVYLDIIDGFEYWENL